MNKQLFQVLHFRVVNTMLCTNLCTITKVLPLMQLQKLPSSRSYVAGLMNLGGESIPVVDLGMRIGIERDQDYRLDTSILLVQEDNHQLGIIVDSILGIDEVNEDQLQMKDEFNQPNSYFKSAVTRGKEVSLLLNLKKILQLDVNNPD